VDNVQALLLAFIQGVTEFLPISSSAHLVLVPALLHWQDQGAIFDIAVHLGTLLAVIIYFWRQVGRLFSGVLDILRGCWSSENARLVQVLALSAIPIVILALFIAGWATGAARSIPLLAATSIGFGLLLGWADRRPTHSGKRKVSAIDALIFGCFQALAIIPGTSRSGVCLTAGRFLGYSREVAGRFGTLMALPVILMAGAYSLLKTDVAGVNWGEDTPVLLFGLGASFIFALAGIHLLMTWLTRVGYWPFVVYRVVLGVGLLVWFYA
jgi:undecaprenyl-diphosphatase